MAASLEAESGLNDAPAILLVAVLAEHAHRGRDARLVDHRAGDRGGAAGRRGRRPADRLRRGPAAAPLGAAPRGLLPPGHPRPLRARLLLGGPRCTRRASSRSTSAAWSSATRPCRTGRPRIGFAEGMASLAQIGLFVLLGLLVSPGRLAEAVGPALLVGGALLLVARPLSVVVSLVWFRFPWTQQLFISWAGLRGAVPIVLATFPLTAEVPGAAFVFDTVFVLVVVFTLVQGWSLPWVARRLGIADPADAARRGGRVRAAGRARRRPHADDGATAVPAARCVPARAAAARGCRRGADRPRRALLRARRHDPASCAATRRCWSRRGGRARRPSGGCARSAGRGDWPAGAARPAPPTEID